MKKQLAVLTTAVAAALGLLLLSACANPFISPRERKNPADGGKGLVRIGTGAGPVRTALPDAVFDHYEYTFSHEGGEDQTLAPITAGGDEFELLLGSWEISVNAYAGSENDTLAATGSETFTVTLGAKTEVTVKLSPIVSEGTGTLNYVLRYPEGAEIKAFTLTLLADETDIDLTQDALSESGSLTGTADPVDAGYYLARAVLQKDGVTAGKNEVVHIYNNMTTELALEFVDDNFKAIVVVSSADNGRGTLREALTSVMTSHMTDAVIRIDLPAGDRVITLTSVLPEITKSLVIEGNGATLTQSGFTESYGYNSQLLYINSNTAEVSISRLHFRGGRAYNNGAGIRNTGTLTLESCIFSDNRTSTSNAYGGAIYTTGNASILGCTFYENVAGIGTANRGGAICMASGTATLSGNIFWGNTAVQRSVVYGSVLSGGFNVSDKDSGTGNAESGWIFAETDKKALSLPVSYISFKPVGGREAFDAIITKPERYPAVDFYGVDIPETNAAAGAVQTATIVGYILDYASIGPGTVTPTGGTSPDADGLINGSVTLAASDGINGSFKHWTVNGTKHSEPSNALTLNVNKDTTVRAVFYTVVTSNDDSGPGTLREALTGISDGGGISLPAGQIITLTTTPLEITKSLVIEGNGAILTQSGFAVNATNPLLRISSTTVIISRLHFKGGRGNTGGGAINNSDTYGIGMLTLESCIFSDNRTGTGGGNSQGGVIYTTGPMNILGCTFYENSASFQGGVIFANGMYSSVTLTGNVFWGNTASNQSNVNGATSGGYNISDKESGTGNAESGWIFAKGDVQAIGLPFWAVDGFKPLSTGAAYHAIDTRPAGYPTTDFYGVEIPVTDATSGAVQTAIITTGYGLDHAADGSGIINLQTASDSYGLYDGEVILEAVPIGGTTFMGWTVNGISQPVQPSPTLLVLTMDGPKIVRAIFVTVVTSFANDGPGSLREALTNASQGDRFILPSAQIIILATPLPEITKSIVIDGNGSTLTQSGFAASATSQLLSITGGTVRISRLHFKGGRATTSGAAIRNTAGILTLESCIFSDNQTTSGTGGAIYTNSTMTISGCTFHENSASTLGGAIFRNNGTVTLTGNVFWGNTAGQHNVVYVSPYFVTSISSVGSNVSDKANGTDATSGSGFTFTNGDIQLTGVTFDAAFRPSHASLPVIAPLPADFPTTYFDGTSRGTTPGAMPAQ